MAWFRLEAGWFRHPKQRAAGKDGRELWLSMCNYAIEQEVDGIVPKSMLNVCAAEAEVKPAPTIQRLVEIGLIDDGGDNWIIHDWLDWQMSKAELDEMRIARSQAGRKGGLKSAQQRATKAQANAQANGKQVLKQTGKQTSTTVQPTSTSTSTSLEVLQVPTYPSLAVDETGLVGWEELDQRVKDACILAAKADYAGRNCLTIKSPIGYMRSTAAKTWARNVEALDAVDPNATAIEIATTVLGLDEWALARAASIHEAI